MGGSDGDPEPRDKEIEYKLIPVPCPIGLDKIHCASCAFSKEGLCDYPHYQRISAVDPNWVLPEDLEELARIRDEARAELEDIFILIDLVTSAPKKVV